MITSPDGIDLHRLVEGAIVEAVIKTHDNAPSVMIDGMAAQKGTDYTVKLQNNVATITMLKDTLRIASIKGSDSEIVVCDLIPEDSAEGRKQLDKYVRGIPDDPRVVLAKDWSDNHKPILRYYTAKQKEGEYDLTLTYVPYPEIDETIVMICPRLEYAVLNEIVAMVLESLNEYEKAAAYRAKTTAA